MNSLRNRCYVFSNTYNMNRNVSRLLFQEETTELSQMHASFEVKPEGDIMQIFVYCKSAEKGVVAEWCNEHNWEMQDYRQGGRIYGKC